MHGDDNLILKQLNAKVVLMTHPEIQKSPPIKNSSLSDKRKNTCLPMGRDFYRFPFSVATSFPMGWDGEIGHWTSLQDMTFSEQGVVDSADRTRFC